jgi:hypothetical protein
MKQIFNSRNKTFHNSIKKLSMIIFLFLPFLILANDFTIVKNGKVVIGLEPTPLEPSVFEAAAIVENYLYKATNNMPQIVSKGKRIIFKIEKGKMDIEGFKFSFPSKEVMLISGGSSKGLKYGALTFCEKYLGIRFLFPGKIGTHIPKISNLKIKRSSYSSQPKYLTRFLYSNNHPTRRPYYNWFPLHRSSVPYRLDLQHNLYKMFPVDKYGKSNPEYYPIINGKRHIPKPPFTGYHWQPCMTSKAVIDKAVEIICDAFAKNPDLRTWSICQNDGDGYCECSNCKKFYPKNDVPHRFGSKDRSILYLQFCNKIAERVTAKYPDATLSIYAYNHTSFAPKNIKLHKALVPIITYDRANHLDKERKRLDLERQNAWKAIASQICWYDYMRSNAYVLPRMLCHHIAQRLREGYDNGVRHFFGEYIPLGISDVGIEKLWCDGPLAYMTFKLLWDPYQDENLILNDWYTTSVGAKAAVHLRNYFEMIEEFWTKKVPHTAWFKRCARTYQVWTWHDYLDALEPGFLDKLENELLLCQKLATKGICRERADYFLKGFKDRRFKIEYYLNNKKTRLISDKEFPYVVFQDNFNQGINNWASGVISGKGPGKPNVWSKNEGTNNSGALVLIPQGARKYAIAEKYFTVKTKGHFFLTVNYRCIGTEEKVIPYISSEWCDKENNILHPVYYRDIHGKNSSTYRQLKLKFTAAGGLPARLRIRLYACNSKTGKVFIDNVVLKATEKDILTIEK